MKRLPPKTKGENPSAGNPLVKPEDQPKAESLKRKASKKSQEPRAKNQDSPRIDSAIDIPHSELNKSETAQPYLTPIKNKQPLKIEHLQTESFGPTSEIKNNSEIEHPKSEIKMEVHHHPEVEKKGLKEYILEGLMIFLAVTMGFYAETIREGISENHTARDFAESMKEDLKKDTIELNRSIYELKFVSFRLDTLVELVHTKKINDLPGGTWYYYGRFGTRYNQFQSVNATLEQLKSSGALRYFRNRAIANEIAQYDESSRKVTFMVGTQAVQNQPAVQVRNKLFDAYYFIPVMDLGVSAPAVKSFKEKKIPLLDDNPRLMIEYANYCQLKSFDNKFIMSLEQNLLEKAKELLNVLNNEYKFE